MSNFDTMFENLLVWEGGFVNHHNDLGGATNMGITLRTLSEWRDNPCTVEDIKKLTKKEAKAIYYQWYYKRAGIDLLPDEFQPFMFDSCVLFGAKTAWRFMQLALNHLDNANLVTDGICGAKTIAAMNEVGRYKDISMDNILEELVRQRTIYHQQRVAANPSQRDFMKGWLNRLKQFGA